MVTVLSACGGGGASGGGGSIPSEPPPVEMPQTQTPLVQAPPAPPQPPPQPPVPPQCIQTHDKRCLSLTEFSDEVESRAPIYEDQDNFKNQWALSTIRADRAYAHLELIKGDAVAPGTSITLGFVDTGIDQTHPLLEGSTINEEYLHGASDETGDRFSHGTAVASVAAAPRLPNYTNAGHGVAWGADIVMFAIRAGRGPALYNPVSLTTLASADATWESIFSSALGWRDGTRAVDFLNLSVGYEGIIDDYSETDLRTHFGDAIAEMAQQGTADKTVFVWAAAMPMGRPVPIPRISARMARSMRSRSRYCLAW